MLIDLLEVDDLTPFATIDPDKAQAMIDDATALTRIVAPCLAATPDQLTGEQVAAAKAILRGAVLRWNESGGAGILAAETAGPFSMSLDTRQPRRAMFWPSEIADLQRICRSSTDGGAYSVDAAPASPMTVHPSYGGWWGGWRGWDNSGFGGWNDSGSPI